jgi:flagellar FliJ protein
MAKFVFNLEPLLEVRRRAEQVEQRAVAELQRDRIALEDALRARQQDITATKADHREGLSGELDMRTLRLGAGTTLQVMRRARQIVLKLAGVHQRIEVARRTLIEATRRRRALELLKERRYAEWKTRLNKAETAALDELAVMAAARTEQRP